MFIRGNHRGITYKRNFTFICVRLVSLFSLLCGFLFMKRENVMYDFVMWIFMALVLLDIIFSIRHEFLMSRYYRRLISMNKAIKEIEELKNLKMNDKPIGLSEQFDVIVMDDEFYRNKGKPKE
jgi:hypothetical protein